MLSAMTAPASSPDGAIHRLWAKTQQGGGDLHHPLICHLLDVAAVAGLMWDRHLPADIRQRVEAALAVPDARALIVFVAGAHDIGKASPAFQKKVPALCDHVRLPFSDNDRDRAHGTVSAVVLKELLGTCPAAVLLGQITGGHHGVFPRSLDLQLGQDTLGNRDWKLARDALLAQFASTVDFDLNQLGQRQDAIADPFIVPFLAGFISVADWIGSNQDFFPCVAKCGCPDQIDTTAYWSKAQRQAEEALHALGWLPTVTVAEEAPFERVFAGFSANSLQRTANDLASKQTAPYLMIAEAPMGQGKTEAALYAADLAMCRGFARGMYIAMPTQATGNAMFRRVLDDYLRKRGHTGRLNLQLVHGDALLAQMAEIEVGEIPEFAPRSIDADGADVEAQTWFTAKKRPLLAPFGVGTIDQSLLSVLQTKHWFVRLFGLAGKVVIFDEVHAYDAYMSTILERLLHWLAEMDCTVILLSATLPEAKRKALAKAYSGRDDAEYRRYPRVTLARPRRYPLAKVVDQPVCAEIPLGQSRTVDVQFARTDPAMLATTLNERLASGGCAAVICNTVNRSIEVYKHLRGTLKDTECLLFHARTLQMWRREREAEVLRKFGKDGRHRRKRAVLVATQVIEQSLDLDFDLMVSEIAPIDLLLQRSGRLHRHERERPPGLEAPQFMVLCDADRIGPPPESFGASIEYVYDRYILLRTWLAMRARDTIDVPTEIEAFVEAVYGESTSDAGIGWSEAMASARAAMDFSRTESDKAAARLLVSRPKDPSDLIEHFNDQLADDDDPEVHRTVRAATREGDPSITVVMLPADANLTRDPAIPEVRRLLDRSAKLSHKGMFQALLEHGLTPAEWAKNAHLRHARLLRLDEQNQGEVGGFVLRADEHLGIVIGSEEA
ncbi:MAG: CRISPR-associated helicase Cas3' [Phycisphaeraceae bacterium]|nr:CRISPR-associated helicase Cas3' [Phycisphaeraceae bacterium]